MTHLSLVLVLHLQPEIVGMILFPAQNIVTKKSADRLHETNMFTIPS